MRPTTAIVESRFNAATCSSSSAQGKTGGPPVPTVGALLDDRLAVLDVAGADTLALELPIPRVAAAAQPLMTRHDAATTACHRLASTTVRRAMRPTGSPLAPRGCRRRLAKTTL